MASDVVRILALGRGETVDRAASGLTGEGYAVAQVDDRRQARRLLKAGDFDVVVADGESKALSELVSEAGGGRPWILLGRADGPVATPENAVWMTPPVQTEALIDRVQELVAAARKPAQKTAGQRAATQKANEARKASARVAGASRPAT